MEWEGLGMSEKQESPVVKAAREYVEKNGGDVKAFIAGAKWKSNWDNKKKFNKMINDKDEAK